VPDGKEKAAQSVPKKLRRAWESFLIVGDLAGTRSRFEKSGGFCAHFLCWRRGAVQAPKSKNNGSNLFKMMYVTIEAISSAGCYRHLFLFTRT
jgi:hypothetical protein